MNGNASQVLHLKEHCLRRQMTATSLTSRSLSRCLRRDEPIGAAQDSGRKSEMLRWRRGVIIAISRHGMLRWRAPSTQCGSECRHGRWPRRDSRIFMTQRRRGRKGVRKATRACKRATLPLQRRFIISERLMDTTCLSSQRSSMAARKMGSSSACKMHSCSFSTSDWVVAEHFMTP